MGEALPAPEGLVGVVIPTLTFLAGLAVGAIGVGLLWFVSDTGWSRQRRTIRQRPLPPATARQTAVRWCPRDECLADEAIANGVTVEVMKRFACRHRAVWRSIAKCLGDGGEVSSGQPDPRATQQEAATPSQGESLATGNVAESQVGPGTRARADHPPSPSSRKGS